MSMITPLFASLYATNLSHNAGAVMFGANQARVEAVSRITGNETPGQIQDLARVDKALQFEGIRAQTLYFAAQLMQDSAVKLQKQHEEQRRRLMEAGATFV